MLTVKKILAGRGAVDYYLNQTRRGLADYYVPEESAAERDGAARLSAPGSSWWDRGAGTLELSGEVARAQFVPLYAKAVGPDGAYLGRRFRLPEEAAAAKPDAFRAAAEISDPYERWMAKHEIRRGGFGLPELRACPPCGASPWGQSPEPYGAGSGAPNRRGCSPGGASSSRRLPRFPLIGRR